MNDLRAQLQSPLGDGYTLERELGGGGMSRLFVARDNALGRDVVVNVLSPPALQDRTSCARAHGGYVRGQFFSGLPKGRARVHRRDTR